MSANRFYFHLKSLKKLNNKSFYSNIKLEYKFDEKNKVHYTILRVYQKRKDGDLQFPFVRVPKIGAIRYSALELSHLENWPLIINAGLERRSEGIILDGVTIQNRKILQNLPAAFHVGSIPLTIDSHGRLDCIPKYTSGKDLKKKNIISAITGFGPIIVNHSTVSLPDIKNVEHFTKNAPRQIIAQFDNNDYAIVTCEGKSHNYNYTAGWTIHQAQQVCKDLKVKFAYNLDGGGNTQTVLYKKQINNVYEKKLGRKVPSFIVFNGTSRFKDSFNK